MVGKPALAIARTLGQPRTDQHDLDDSSEFLDATWRVVLAEIRCDEELRAARRLILRDLKVPAELMLASDLASSLELASDRLMSVSYAQVDPPRPAPQKGPPSLDTPRGAFLRPPPPDRAEVTDAG